MLMVGSEGPQVVEWQVFLKQHGYFTAGLAPVFGPKTYAATLAFQKAEGLDADGIVGPRTRAVAEDLQTDDATDNGGDDGTLTLDEVARRAGIPLPVLKAIRKVESRGKPSAIRFEPHLFHRHRPDLAARVPYTRSDRGYSLVATETNAAALERAMEAHPEAAIRSASFGSYQVLGGYLLEAYPGAPGDAYAAFKSNPSEASDLMVAAWFKDNRRARDAANSNPPDFRALAKAYNGPNFHVHKYDERLSAAWEKMK